MGRSGARVTAVAEQQAEPASARPVDAAGRGARLSPLAGGRGELVGYAVIAVGLLALLWANLRQVDQFYLDEWFYVHGGEYIWEHLPGGLIGTIPDWNRGPQRLYSSLLGIPFGLFGTPTAFAISHFLNAVLLVSSVVPAALLARRTIAAAPLRVLAVALAVAVPWLIVGAHLLTENVAFPLFLWATYAIVRAAEQPTWWTQAWALGAVCTLAVCRLNLAVMGGVLVLAVVVAELRRRREQREQPLRPWLAGALRRHALVAGFSLLAGAAALVLLTGASSRLGAYGGFSFDSIGRKLFGADAEITRRTMLTYVRSLAVGAFVFPFALGLGTALAGTFGRLGPRLLMPSLVTLAGFVLVIVTTSVWTAGAALEERYVFYPCAPLAVMAVAGVEHVAALRRWVAAAAVLTVWALYAGWPWAGVDSGHFFTAPAGAFWARVVEHRLRSLEDTLLGPLLLPPTTWILLAVALGALVVFVGLGRARPRLVSTLLAGGLALCVLAQVSALTFDFKQHLHGTAEAPGGVIGSEGHAERDDWVDEALPGGGSAVMLPGLISPGTPWAGLERVTMFNKRVDATLQTLWDRNPYPVPPGFKLITTELGEDGVARWTGARFDWLVAQRDDPRVQWSPPGRRVAVSETSPYALERAPRERAVWTADGLDADGAVRRSIPVEMALDRAGAPGVRSVTLTIAGPVDAGTAQWRVMRDGRSVADGRLAQSRRADVRLAVPACAQATACAPVRWRLLVSNKPVDVNYPAYGPPGPVRKVTLWMTAARLGA